MMITTNERLTIKRMAFLLVLVFAFGWMLFLAADDAEASDTYYFIKPANNASYQVGDTIQISYYCGLERSKQHYDEYGNPSYIIYDDMPVDLKILKGKEKLDVQTILYQRATTVNKTYTPKTTGKITLELYGRNKDLYDNSVYLQDSLTINVSKAANPLKVETKNVSVKYKKLKKKNQTIKRAKAITITGAKGRVTYKVSSVKKAKFKKFFNVNAKNGNITIKKKLKKGSYKLNVNVTAAGNSQYKAISKTAAITVKVK